MGHPRVLLVSYYFAPQNAIGAVRPAKLAKYLLMDPAGNETENGQEQ